METMLRIPTPVLQLRSGGLCFWGGVLLALFSAPALATELPEPGAQGYGLSVFQGETPERFEVEVLGTLHGWGGTGNVILARLSGASLEHTGVLQGMSGSPVYIDDELVGAVMSTWAFAKDPIAGIRPIAEMRDLGSYLDRGEHPDWVPGQSRVEASSIPPGLDGARPVQGLLWTASGFAPALQSEMEQVLGAPVQASAGRGADSGTVTGTLEPGDAMAALLVDGDARLASIGTATAREGDTVLGFGHPFLSAGPVSLPMARARVVALLASEQISFKMGEATEVVGALLVDRRAGVSGKLGVVADMLPVDVTVTSAGATHPYSFRVARVRDLLPSLVSWSVQSALNDREEARPQSTVEVEVTLELEGEDPLTTRAMLSGRGLGAGLTSEVSWPIGLVRFNSDRPVRIERVRVALAVDSRPRSARIGQVHLTPTSPRPGDVLQARVELLPVLGEPEWVQLSIPIPAHLAAGPMRLHLLDGGTAFREELGRAQPRWSYPGFGQIRDALALREPASALVGVLYAPPTSVVVRGVELEQVPPRVREVMTRSGTKDGASAVEATAVTRVAIPTSWVLDVTRHIPFELAPSRRP